MYTEGYSSVTIRQHQATVQLYKHHLNQIPQLQSVPEEELWKSTPTCKRVSALGIEPERFIVGEILPLSDEAP